jgi:hypothetical protein
VKLLRDYYFSPPPQVDFSDIDTYEYLKPIEVFAGLKQTEIIRAVLKIKKDNFLKSDKILNKVFYLLISDKPTFLIRFFDACYRLSIYFITFKRAITVLLRKLKKEDYLNSKVYRLIALFNILKKVLKAVITERIRFAAETYTLFSNI